MILWTLITIIFGYYSTKGSDLSKRNSRIILAVWLVFSLLMYVNGIDPGIKE